MNKPIIRKGVQVEVHPILSILSKPVAKEETIDRNGRLHASQVGHCPRAGALSATEVYDSQNSISSTYYMKIGTVIHDIVRDSFQSQGVLVASEARIPRNPFNLGGYIDDVINLDGEISIVEVKSCGKPPSRPHAGHLAQASLYAALVGLPYHIVYVSRNIMGFNSLQIQPFSYPTPLAPPVSLFNMIYASLYVQRGMTPPIPFSDDSECRFCDHYARCWGSSRLDIQNPEPGPVEDQKIRAVASRIAERMMRPANVAYRRWLFFREMKVEAA